MTQLYNQQQLAQAMSWLMQQSTAAGVTTKESLSGVAPQFGHGPGGTFSRYGLNRDFFNAMILPQLGVLNRLPILPSRFLSPQTGILLGQRNTGTTDPSPNDNCEPCRVVGDLKMGAITANFGRTCVSTKTIDLSGDIGGMRSWQEFRDFRLIGGAAQLGQLSPAAPTMPASMANPLNAELDKELFQLYVGWARDVYSPLLWSGNPANNVGKYKEFRGFYQLINTGYQDAETGALMRAADSLIINFQNQNITTGGAAVASSIVQTLTGMHRRLKQSATKQGLSPVKWILAMPEQLFYELTAVWPCAYFTDRCQNGAEGSPNNMSATENRNMVESMRQGFYLLMDGQQVEVQIDDSIREVEASGVFTSQIAFIPLTVLGGVPSTYIEFFDYDNPDNTDVRNLFGTSTKYISSDGGRFLWTRRENGFCVSMDTVERSRLRLETPWLAARLLNVRYSPLIQTKSGYPTDGDRFYDGPGVTTQSYPYMYPPTIYNI